ncbi:hypothetical protein LCGC14_0208000 [marine sediment metagenome]|uniref:Uncharacterized protein n=1 Tax=marine sediment metagenome TaxID=412755 RepID=A0A0F9UL03_9ZZZZ
MANTVALYYTLPWSQSEVVLDKDEWVICKSPTDYYAVWHRHDDRYGGGRNGPPYLARCGPTHCQDCSEPVPIETQGFLNLTNWKR